MAHDFENPFTPKKALPQKRLFIDAKKKRKLGSSGQERIGQIKEKLAKVKYGELEILKSQIEPIKKFEMQFKARAKQYEQDISQEGLVDLVVSGLEVDKTGNIIGLDFYKIDEIYTLGYLPQSINKLVKLKSISLSAHDLEGLPETIGDLENLEVLILDANGIKKIPEAILKLVNLKNLKLDHNKLESFPEGIAKLKKLESLALNENNFSEEEIERIKSQLPEKCELEI